MLMDARAISRSAPKDRDLATTCERHGEVEDATWRDGWSFWRRRDHSAVT